MREAVVSATVSILHTYRKMCASTTAAGLLILPETELDATRVLAERIRETIGERPLLVDFQRIGVTVSLGVACMVGGMTLDELSQEADRAMYLAKRGGRNRVASVERKPVHLTSTAH